MMGLEYYFKNCYALSADQLDSIRIFGEIAFIEQNKIQN